jgi:hypothetical protein
MLMHMKHSYDFRVERRGLRDIWEEHLRKNWLDERSALDSSELSCDLQEANIETSGKNVLAILRCMVLLSSRRGLGLCYS